MAYSQLSTIQGTPAAEAVYGPAPGKFIETTHGRTHCMLQGPADAPLILLQHGLAANLSIWDTIASELVSRGYRVLRFDFYDRGWSETSPTRYPVTRVGVHPLKFTIDLYVEQVDDVLTSLGLGEASFVYLGNSTGGGVGIALAAKYTTRVLGLLLLSPVCLKSAIPLIARIADAPVLGPILVQLLGNDTLYRASYKMRHDPNHPWQVRDLGRLKQILATNIRFLASIRSTTTYCRSFNYGTLLAEYEIVCKSGIPIQIIWGTLDNACPYPNAVRMLEIGQSLSANVKLETFEGQPHVFFTADAKEAETLQLTVDMLEQVCGSRTAQGATAATCRPRAHI
jgi:pimeloyl-ACP methyl ester carboxylesterase